MIGAVMEKPKFAFYGAATCGGCDVAILDIEERILDVIGVADVVLWPIAMDFKYKDVEAMEAKSIDVCLFNGAVRNSEHEHLARVLREKSKIMIAFGSCACFGGIPGLANVANREQIFNIAYKETPSTTNPEGVIPLVEVKVAGEKLTLPEFFDTVKTLDQTVNVDYYLPGCPPPVERINDAVGMIKKFVETGELPHKGTVIASERSLCDECDREKEEKRKLKAVYRAHEIRDVDPKKCLLDQGILCMGPATRGGCGQRCINANMPCRGCMGPTPASVDQGAAYLSAIASILGIEEEKELSDEEVSKLVDQIKDPLGTFYRFSLPAGLIRKAIVK